MVSIFISSTSRDLFAHRQAVIEALKQAGTFPVTMEYFGSQDGDATEISRKEVQNSDIFIGVYARRYGYIPDGKQSIIEMEYEEAVRLKKTCFMFIVADDYHDQLVDQYAETNEEEILRLQLFKRKIINKHVRVEFSTPTDLATKVLGSLTRWMNDQQDNPHQKLHVVEEAEETPEKTRNLVDKLPIRIGGNINGGMVNIGGTQTVHGDISVSMPERLQHDQVQFSSYYPRSTQPEKRYSLFVYAHTEKTFEKIQQDVIRFEDELGGSVRPARIAKQAAEIERGTLIRMVPECDEIEFDPPYLEKKWRGDWTRYEFDFIPQQKHIGESLWVRVSVQIAGIEIAHIKCDIEVTNMDATKSRSIHAPEAEKSSLMPGDVIPSNRLAVAKLKSKTAPPYQKIFISYSRKDGEVARAYRLAQIAFGQEVFLDTENIRAGEDWQAALAKAIDEADIFQLFWSEHSAASPNVRDEWDYCLKHKCVEDECRGFIRPVYWKKPMPAPPSELGHLNFRFVPLQPEENG